jgi:hypothetical protein
MTMLKEHMNAIVNILNDVININAKMQEALMLIANHPVETSEQWETGAQEMIKLARKGLGVYDDNTTHTDDTDGHAEGSGQSASGD